METSLPRLRRLAVSVQTFRRLALASAVMLTVIVASGATVRLTGSGLGCKHWPGCTAGDPFPSAGYHSYVEFSNRLVATLTIVATLAAFVAALMLPTARSWLRVASGAVFLGTLGQAPLGAITVYYHLNPWLVLSHFLLSLAVLAVAVLVAVEAFDLRGEPVSARLAQLGLFVGVVLCVLVVTGTLATAAGPHSGGSDVRRLGTLQGAVWLHVRAVAVFGISFALLATWLVVRRSRHLRAALALLGLLAVEMTIGEIQYRTQLPWGLVLVHVFVAALVWVSTIVFVARLWRPVEPGVSTNGELRVERRPDLEKPVLICSFRGWNDGGQGASLATSFLARAWNADKFAEIDPELFFDFQSQRPQRGPRRRQRAPDRLAREQLPRDALRARPPRCDPAARHRAEPALADVHRARDRSRAASSASRSSSRSARCSPTFRTRAPRR